LKLVISERCLKLVCLGKVFEAGQFWKGVGNWLVCARCLEVVSLGMVV
jgi:hypothetical protein